MSIASKLGRLFGGAVAESLVEQLRAKHLECEALKQLIRECPTFIVPGPTGRDMAEWNHRAYKAIGDHRNR